MRPAASLPDSDALEEKHREIVERDLRAHASDGEEEQKVHEGGARSDGGQNGAARNCEDEADVGGVRKPHRECDSGGGDVGDGAHQSMDEGP